MPTEGFPWAFSRVPYAPAGLADFPQFLSRHGPAPYNKDAPTAQPGATSLRPVPKEHGSGT